VDERLHGLTHIPLVQGAYLPWVRYSFWMITTPVLLNQIQQICEVKIWGSLLLTSLLKFTSIPICFHDAMRQCKNVYFRNCTKLCRVCSRHLSSLAYILIPTLTTATGNKCLEKYLMQRMSTLRCTPRFATKALIQNDHNPKPPLPP